jgi:histone deacetylase 6
MLDYHCLWDDNYPEKPDRIKKPFERCELYGLVDKCQRLSGRECTDNEIELYHTKRVNEMMKSTETYTYDNLKEVSKEYDSMYFHNGVNKAARFALGSSIQLLENIMENKVDNGFAIIRPPGHHAMRDEPNGYCYFNNAAICAQLAIDKYKLERVLIVDWDGILISF